MKQETFWQEASRYGAIVGAVEILFLLLEALLYKSAASSLLSLAQIVVFVTLIYLFTKRRATLYGDKEGYTYGNGLRFIFFVSIFAGILCGAYEIAARNWLFPNVYRDQMQQAFVALSQMKLYSNTQIREIKEMSETISFSPIWIVLGDVLGMIVRGVFFGLFVAAFTRREPNIFSEE